MFCRRLSVVLSFVLPLVALAIGALPARAQNGPILGGAGAVNRSMGGASVAAPIDGMGALYWNPATTSGLPSSSIDFGVELLYPYTRLSSSIAGLGSGSNNGDNGVFPLPSMGLVYRDGDSPLTYGLGIFPVAGFGVNYPSSTTNPILTPQPPFGVGLGSIYSELQVVQIAPMVSYALTDRLAVGVGPTVNLASLRADPLFVAQPNANGDFPPGTHARQTWGGGFQLGIYYVMDSCWSFGASFKSTQWFEDFIFQSTDARGLPRSVPFSAELPMIASVGAAYSGIERLILAADFRYVDYDDADAFGQSGFTPTGAVRGLGFRSIFAMALGAQYQLTDCASVRIGYTYTDNPIPDSQSTFNVASPTILEHTLFLGASYKVSDALTLSAAYGHAFENSIEGPLVTPGGPVPGSSVKSTTSVDTFIVSASVKFGCQK